MKTKTIFFLTAFLFSFFGGISSVRAENELQYKLLQSKRNIDRSLDLKDSRKTYFRLKGVPPTRTNYKNRLRRAYNQQRDSKKAQYLKPELKTQKETILRSLRLRKSTKTSEEIEGTRSGKSKLYYLRNIRRR